MRSGHGGTACGPSRHCGDGACGRGGGACGRSGAVAVPVVVTVVAAPVVVVAVPVVVVAVPVGDTRLSGGRVGRVLSDFARISCQVRDT